MGSIAGSDAYLLFASQSAILTVVMLGILWSARSTAVYLYLLSSLVGAGYFLIFALAAPAGAMTASMTFLALSITAIGSAWLKNIALGLLDSPKFPLSGYLRAPAPKPIFVSPGARPASSRGGAKTAALLFQKSSSRTHEHQV